MDCNEEALSEGFMSDSEYMHEPVASSSSDKYLGEADDEQVLHEHLLSYETMKTTLILTLAVTELSFSHYYFIFCG